jgi:hypothetical protein
MSEFFTAENASSDSRRLGIRLAEDPATSDCEPSLIETMVELGTTLWANASTSRTPS